jgi:hypothetical protein
VGGACGGVSGGDGGTGALRGRVWSRMALFSRMTGIEVSRVPRWVSMVGFLLSQGGPFLLSQGGPFLLSQGGPFLWSQGGPFLLSQGGPFLLSQGGPFPWWVSNLERGRALPLSVL